MRAPSRTPLSLTLLACLAATNGHAAGAADGPPPVPVTVERAQAQSLGASITATGEVASRSDAEISAEVAGRLVWIAEPGAAVASGATIARIDAAELTLDLRESDAAVRRLEAEARLLGAQRDRLRALGGNGVVSAAQLEEATARHEMAVQQLEQSRVLRDRARLALQRAEIRAPFAGAVVERLRDRGEYLTVGAPLLRLVDTRQVEVVARAPLSAAQLVRPGTPARLEANGQRVTGKVRAVVPVGDERSRLLELRVQVAGTDWPVGAPVRVQVDGAAAKASVAVPRDAVILRQSETYVYRVGDDGVAERVAVQVGAGRGPNVTVAGGLRPGDRVIVRGGERLQPGQAVTVTNERTTVAKTG
jgi:RND family efflux transporter MFP subunit